MKNSKFICSVDFCDRPRKTTWFIARTHRFSKYIHWRNGVLLEDKEKKHLGLVIARPESKEVWLRVKGLMPYYFFALLRDTLELTFNRFEGLKRIVKVPCPSHIQVDDEEWTVDSLSIAAGAELRFIRQILSKEDTGNHWCGLERVVTPEGHILWLCSNHAKEYK